MGVIAENQTFSILFTMDLFSKITILLTDFNFVRALKQHDLFNEKEISKQLTNSLLDELSDIDVMGLIHSIDCRISKDKKLIFDVKSLKVIWYYQ